MSVGFSISAPALTSVGANGHSQRPWHGLLIDGNAALASVDLDALLHQQAGQRDDDAGGAEAALGRPFIDDRLLDRGQAGEVEALDGDQMLALQLKLSTSFPPASPIDNNCLD